MGLVRIMLDGSPRTLDERELVTEIRRADQLRVSANLEAIRARCRMGWLFIQGRERLGWGSYELLARAAGVSPKTARRAVRDAAACVDPDTGAFDAERYEPYRKQINDDKRAGRSRAHVDADGHPSLTGFEHAVGARSAPRALQNGPEPRDSGPKSGVLARLAPGGALRASSLSSVGAVETPAPAFAGGAAAFGPDGVAEPGRAEAETASTPARPGAQNAAGVAGAQMTLGFEAREMAGRLREALDVLASAIDGGDVGGDSARGVLDHADELDGEIRSLVGGGAVLTGAAAGG